MCVTTGDPLYKIIPQNITADMHKIIINFDINIINIKSKPIMFIKKKKTNYIVILIQLYNKIVNN